MCNRKRVARAVGGSPSEFGSADSERGDEQTGTCLRGVDTCELVVDSADGFVVKESMLGGWFDARLADKSGRYSPRRSTSSLAGGLPESCKNWRVGLWDVFKRRQPGQPASDTVPPPQRPDSATQQLTHPPGPAGEARLDIGGTVSVSDEDQYQDALAAALQGVKGDFGLVTSTLHLVAGNPHATKPDVPVMEVRIHGNTVGFFTSAMTKRYQPLLETAEAQGRILTASTAIDRNPQRTKGPPIEVSLLAVPRLEEQRNIAGLDVEVTDAEVINQRTLSRHVLRSESPDGRRTACGLTLKVSDTTVVRRTKPWVGWVTDDGSIVEGSGHRCAACANASNDGSTRSTRPRAKPVAPGPGPGRYGKQTDVTGKRRGRQFPSRMNEESVLEVLTHGLDFDVAGESFRPGYPDNLLRLADVLDNTEGPEWVGAVLVRDPKNEYDRNAIEVHVAGGDIGHVGFVPAQLAAILAPIMDSGRPLTCNATEVRIGSGGDARPGLTVCVKVAG